MFATSHDLVKGRREVEDHEIYYQITTRYFFLTLVDIAKEVFEDSAEPLI